jgi:phosphoglycolate phosphatase
VIVVTAKLEATARLSLDALGLVPDAVFGGVHGPEKAAVLSSVGATVYVGDTPADIAAAVTAGARPVGVATGSFTGDELRAAGAVDVLASLGEFPALYQSLGT